MNDSSRQRIGCVAKSNETAANAAYRSRGRDYSHEALSWSSSQVKHSSLSWAAWFPTKGPQESLHQSMPPRGSAGRQNSESLGPLWSEQLIHPVQVANRCR